MTDTLQNVAHVAPEPIVEKLQELGAREVVGFPDVLSHGPCHPEPKRHREIRLEYWGDLYRGTLGDVDDAEVEAALKDMAEGYLSTEQIGSVAAHQAESRRVVVWTTPTFQDRLFLWMVFDALREADVAVERIATAEPQVPAGPEAERYTALRDLTVDELREGFEALFYPEEIYVQAGADWWQTYASSSPRKVAISVPHTEKFFPEITTIAEDYGGFFPVQRGEDASRAEVSDLDRQLLGSLSTQHWQTPLAVLGAEFLAEFDYIDDLVVADRLAKWAALDREPAYVEGRVGDGEAPVFERRQYRLTEAGEALLQEGFGEAVDAPVMEVGDCRIYAGPTPWVRVIADDHWWFERYSSDR